MTNIGRVFDSITMILMITLFIILLVSEVIFIVFKIGLSFAYLILIIILPFYLIHSRIYNKALKKNKAKIRDQRLRFCMYCGGKLDSFQNFCPFCGRTFDQTAKIITKTTEIEKYIQEEYYKDGKPLTEQKEIINKSRKSNMKSFLRDGIIVEVVLSILMGILMNDFIAFLYLLIFASLFMMGCMLFVGYIMNSGFIYSRFLITAEEFKLYLEKKLYFQINWSDIDKIDIYQVRSHNYYLKINYSNSYKIISLGYCDYDIKTQKEIINALFLYSGGLKHKISVMKTSVPILDEMGMKDLYKEIYHFARAQRFICK